jgi:hypothetical protein
VNISLIEKIHSQCVRNPMNGCLEWHGARDRCGYGRFWDGTRHRPAHRMIFEAFFGELPKEILALHRCDNPPCCDETHLFSGTDQDNSDDKVAKGRQPKGETHGMFGKTNVGGGFSREQGNHGQPDVLRKYSYRKLSDGDHSTICASTESSKVLAKRYGVHYTHINWIKRSKGSKSA